MGKVIDFSPDNLERIAYLQKNVFATSSFISMRLDAYDFRANPELIEKQKPNEIPIYVLVQRKLDKSSLRLRDLAFGKEVFLGIGEIAEIS